LATNSHRDITNRNQPLLFFHMDPTNSIGWTRKSFIGSLMLCRVGFQQILGSKISDGSQLSAQFPWPVTNSHRDITNRNQPLLFFHMDPTNSIVWTRKSFIGSLVSCRVGFQQILGQKSVMDPISCHHNFLGHQQPQGHNKRFDLIGDCGLFKFAEEVTQDDIPLEAHPIDCRFVDGYQLWTSRRHRLSQPKVLERHPPGKVLFDSLNREAKQFKGASDGSLFREEKTMAAGWLFGTGPNDMLSATFVISGITSLHPNSPKYRSWDPTHLFLVS
jgi:hypothetical protein